MDIVNTKTDVIPVSSGPVPIDEIRVCSPGITDVLNRTRCGRSSMAEQKLPKLTTGVRFPSPAPPVISVIIRCT